MSNKLIVDSFNHLCSPTKGHNYLFNEAFENGKSRFYYNGHGYFAVGAKVKAPSGYHGIDHGTVTDVIDGHHGTSYRVKYHVKGHPEAHDENGDPIEHATKLHKDTELTKHNPEHEWDGK